MTRRITRLVGVLIALSLVAAACGRDDKIKASPGFDGKTIKLGVLWAETDPPTSPGLSDAIGKPLTAGGDAYWAKVNAAGGVAGKYKVDLVKADSQYVDTKTKEQYTKIKNDVVMFSQVLGTPPTKAILGDLKTDNIVAAPASLDAAWVKEANLLPIGSTYQIQFANAASWLINDEGFKGKPICMMAIESAYGDAGIQGLNAAATELGFKVAATQRFKGTPTETYTGQIEQLKKANCAAVFLTGLPGNTGKIIATDPKFAPRWIGQSPTWVSALAASAVAPLLQKSFYLASEGTTWGDNSVPGMKELITDALKYAPTQKPDIYFVFGYGQAKAVHALLEQAVKNDDLSRAGIKKALEGFEVDFGGLFGGYTYGPAADRHPSAETVMFKVNPAVPGALEKVKSVTSPAADKLKAG